MVNPLAFCAGGLFNFKKTSSMKIGDKVRISEAIDVKEHELSIGWNPEMRAVIGSVGVIRGLVTGCDYPYASVTVGDTNFSYLLKALEPIQSKYNPGDWVVLGKGGAGWHGDIKGRVVKIKDIGPHLKGKLHDADCYDFFIERHPSYEKEPRFDQLMRSDGGGESKNIARLATAAEIAKVLGYIDDVFKEYPLRSEVWYPRGQKKGVVIGRNKGILPDDYPLLVQFQDGQMAFTSDGFPEISFRNSLMDRGHKLQLIRKFGQTPTTEKTFQLNFTPTS